MYLKSIEVQGFKSFAYKMVFDFHNGITGIVGPNGSGKSNVADAVRWVLGEQKVRQLRSNSMQDVIFAGTENRKPVSFAYVAITLDNSDRKLPLDYSEVTVARRVYRSGESEYLLNGTVCRLKDVNELFYDTGIGKEGYSIIGQGQIDRILSGKPEERRELFDEAAGIVKFKRRKATAQKKLESEQQNLLRVNDIIAELERQLGPLERQSEHAKTYLKKREELKDSDIRLFLVEMERIEREQEEIEGKSRIAGEQQNETAQRLAQIRARYEEMAGQIEQTERQAEEFRQQINDSGVEREKLEGQINVLREQIRAQEQREEHLQGRMDSLKEEIKRRQQSGEEYSRQQEELDRERETIHAQKGQVSAELEELRRSIEECEAAMERNKSGLIALLGERASMKGEQERCDAILEQARIHRSQLQQQLLSNQSSKDGVAGQLDVQEKELEAQNEQIAGLEEQKADVERQRQKWLQKFEELRARLDQLREQFHRESSRLESLRNIAERYDGYGSSIRRVMERRADTKGIHGVVADIIKVDQKYETAIETALGGNIQNIVTEDEDTAKEMIAYLKKNRYGRVTFLPLTSVSGKGRAADPKALTQPGVIGMADTLVHTEERYRGVAGYLLGRILVVDTIDHAIALEKKFHYSLRVVTLEGESLQPGGSMTGGAFCNNSSLLGRNREIEALEKKIEGLRQEAKEIRSSMEDARTARALLKDDLEELQVRLQEAYLKQNTLVMAVEHIREERRQQEASRLEIQEEIRQIGVQEKETADSLQRIADRIRKSQLREQEFGEENGRLEQRLTQEHAKQESVQERLSEVTLKEAQLTQQSDFLRENIQRVAEEILRLQQEEKELAADESGGRQIIAEREQEIRMLTESIAAGESGKGDLEKELAACIRKKEEMAAEQREFFDRREELSQEMSRLDREIFRLGSQREKLEAAGESLTAYMWEEYEITRHFVPEEKKQEDVSVPELKRRIAQIREEIRALGNVNVNAIEEYKNISERYQFLHGQQEDLIKAEETLRNVIRDLDEGMRRQFAEKFADIQREFNRAFQQLFGGGRGTLTLTEEDILECGVSIIAQPPGKKLQNMMQLSGGEKALTAIALLFAIQNLKPSPFCLLDEIEAALDDSNVDRFAKYLHKLTKNTQFIIITHRRGTMAAADRLYGITMQEKGVSALVSVNLIEKDLEE